MKTKPLGASALCRMATAVTRPFTFACLVAIASLGWTGWAAANKCSENSYILRSQAEVDAFPQDCDDVQGDVRVEGADITNLDGLSGIINIGGSLFIENNPALPSLEGLLSLLTVGTADLRTGFLVIRNNPIITQLEGLHNLRASLNRLEIAANRSLADLDALGAFAGEVRGRLEISSNDRLANINGLANITSLGLLLVEDNQILSSLHGLTGITSVGVGLSISGNSRLESMIGLANITSVGTDTSLLQYGYTPFFFINSNESLKTLQGLEGITKIGGTLSISDNPALTDLDGLSSVTVLASADGRRDIALSISSNKKLTNVDGLANITAIEGNLSVFENVGLTNIDGLGSIASVGGLLSIEANNTLINCQNIAALLGWPNGPPDDSVSDDIVISGNATGCNSVAEVIASYTPPPASDRFNALMQTVQATRGAGNSQQAQATSESPAEAEVVLQLAKEEGVTVRAKAAGTTGEPESIPVMPYYLMLMMACLVGLFGQRRLRS